MLLEERWPFKQKMNSESLVKESANNRKTANFA